MSLGGVQSTEQSLSPWMERAAQDALGTATQASQIGFVPYKGPDVAAFNPMQTAAFDGTNMAASAYGMPTAASTGLPKAQTFAGGMQGYSSFPMYQQSVRDLRRRSPGQYDAIMSMFVDPQTGMKANQTQQQPGLLTPPQSGGGSGSSGFMQRPTGTSTGPGYTSFGDMFDGGGPGTSGATYSGLGPVSKVANVVTGSYGQPKRRV